MPKKPNAAKLTSEQKYAIIHYMQTTPNFTYSSVIKKFNCSKRQAEQLKKDNNITMQEKRTVQTAQFLLRQEGLRKCPVCNVIHPLSEFYHYRLGNCKKCEKERGLKKYATRIQKMESDISFLLHSRLREAKLRKWQCTITLDELLTQWENQKGLCFYTNRPMSLKTGERFVASLDRQDSTKGYISGNVVICGLIVNQMKTNLELSEFIQICKDIAQN
jgi:hypothetical protein